MLTLPTTTRFSHHTGDLNASNVAVPPYADLTGTSITSLNAEAVDNDIVVNWDTVAGAESYRFYYSITMPPPIQVALLLRFTTRLSHFFKPEVETVYYFQVRAIAKGGNSNISTWTML